MKTYVARLFKGRINRRNYLAGNLLLFVLGVTYCFVLGIILIFQNGKITPAQIIIVLPFCGLLIVYRFSFLIRRAHDLGLGGRNAFVASELDCWFEDGEGKENKYGKPCKPEIDIKSLFTLEA